MLSLRLGDVTVDPATGEMAGPGGREQLDPKVMQVLLAPQAWLLQQLLGSLEVSS